MTAYVVLMRRWGERETHCYLYGCYTKLEAAIEAAEEGADERGGKYTGVVYLCTERNSKEVHRTEGYKREGASK